MYDNDVPRPLKGMGENALPEDVRRLSRLYEMTSAHGHRFVLVNSLTKALEISYPSLDASLYSSICAAHEASSEEPPDISPQRLCYMRRILYILLELGHLELAPLFRRLGDDRLPISRESLIQELDQDELRKKIGHGWETFYDRFIETQGAWCPLIFDLDMEWDKVVHRYTVIPFYKKQPIPRAGAEPSEDHARLYEVHIPAEFVVAKGLDVSHLLLEDTLKNDQDHRFYRFALKKFSQALKPSYDKEVRTFRALRAQSGMIQYYGCYESGENPKNPTYNILLEYADFDLTGAISKEAPPVSPDEIKSFWGSMHEVAATLANIHHLNINGQEYDFWHGDIKPDNILRVGDHFKLADPGDSSIQRSRKDRKYPKAEVYGGTRTYAAPEKAKWLEAGSTPLDKILQNSDVWSLGCVFSVAATYVVLGDQGVNLYDSIRRRAHAKRNKDLVLDVFHDNEKALGVIKEWHKYLRITARRADAFTAAVLDMVDDYMLVPAEQRWEAEGVSNHFEKLLSVHGGVGEVPHTIDEMLQELDLEAEIDQEFEGGINRLDSDMARRHFQHEQQSKGPSIIAKARFGNEAMVLNTKIKPTAQRSVHRSTLLKNYSQRAASTSSPTAASPVPSIDHRHLLPLPDRSATSITNSLVTIFRISNVFQVREQLESWGKSKNLWSPKHTSVRGKLVDDPLRQYYEDRDIIFLVDNGSTMEQHWAEVGFVLETLVWRIWEYDSDGMELYFTNQDTEAIVGPGRKQDVQDFVKALRAARPPPEKHASAYTKTVLRPRLNAIMANYYNAKVPGGKKKRLTVLILTDGAWEGIPYEDDIDRWMSETICQLAGKDPKTIQATSPDVEGNKAWQKAFEQDRLVTFQFIAFGHNENGLTRMRRLDNLLVNQGLPDVIDMEPSNGDVYKMFLGSISPQWDRTENSVNKESTVQSPQSSVSQGFDLGYETPRRSMVVDHNSVSSASFDHLSPDFTPQVGSPNFVVSPTASKSQAGPPRQGGNWEDSSVGRSPSRRRDRGGTSPRSSILSLPTSLRLSRKSREHIKEPG